MTRDALVQLIIEIVTDYLLVMTNSPGGDFTEETRLFGGKGLLDSLGLVSVVLDVEQQVNDRLGTALALTDDRAMSQQRSPFRSIGSLADYVMTLLEESQRG